MTAVTYSRKGTFWTDDKGAKRQAAFVEEVQRRAAEGETVETITRAMHTKRFIVRELLGKDKE